MTEIFSPQVSDSQLKSISTLGLAHIGDGVYELLIRTMLIAGGQATSASLHRATISWVSASAQSGAADKILPLLTEAEMAVFRRGRNARVGTVPHNTERAVYMKATALEALFGWLYLRGESNRLMTLFTHITEG